MMMLICVDETLRMKKIIILETPIPNGDVEISFSLPKRDWGDGQFKPNLNLYLYDNFENSFATPLPSAIKIIASRIY